MELLKGLVLRRKCQLPDLAANVSGVCLVLSSASTFAPFLIRIDKASPLPV